MVLDCELTIDSHYMFYLTAKSKSVYNVGLHESTSPRGGEFGNQHPSNCQLYSDIMPFSPVQVSAHVIILFVFASYKLFEKISHS